MKYRFIKYCLSLFFVMGLMALAQAQNFTSGNLAVAKITNSSVAITDDGAATAGNALLRQLSIMQFATTGSSQAGTAILAINATGTSPKLTIDQRRIAHEGQLNLSANGQYLVLVGYNSEAGLSATTSPNGRFAEKRIARIDASGNIDLSSSIPTASAFNNFAVRGAVMNGNVISVNGSGATSTSGVQNITFGTSTATTFLAKDCRSIGLFGGNVYSYSSASPFTIEGGGQTTISGLTTDNTQFVFFDLDNAVSWGTTGYDLLYVAHRNSGINKYYFDAGTSAWVAAGLANSSIQSSTGFQSLTGAIEGGKPTLYGTKTVITSSVYISSHLVKVVDNAARTATLSLASPAIELAATGNTEMLKGVAFTPSGLTPTITLTGTTTPFSTNQGTASATQNYTVSGANLSANITLTAPTGFEISTSAGSGFGGSLTLTQTSGSVSSTVIYVRLTGASAGTPNGNITHSSTGATTQNMAVSGTVTAVSTPTISITGTPLSAFTTSQGTASASQNYTVSGSALTANISLIAPTDFEISKSAGSSFGGSLTLTQTSGSVLSTVIYVRLTGASAGTPSGNISHTSSGATAVNVAVSGTVNAVVAPAITITGTLAAFATVQGTPSSTRNYSVAGTNLTANILLSAPTGFEISTMAGGGYASSLSLTPTSGSIAITTIYARLIGTSVGSVSGNIKHTSTGAVTQNVAVSGTVSTPATSFSKNNITVLRIGDGTTTLDATAAKVDLLEISSTGTPTGFNIALPSTGTNKLVLGGASTTYEGQLALSADNRYLAVVGYNAALGAVSSTTVPSMQTSEKIIARIGFDNVVDMSTKIPITGTGSGFGANNVRNVASDDGSVFYVAGSVTARQINYGTSNSSAISGGNSWRSVNRFGGVTYGINFQVPQFANLGVVPNVATDLPSVAAVNALPNFTGGGSATGIVLLDADPAVSYNTTGYDLLYITEIGNGIRKWYFDAASGFWTPAGIINPVSVTGITGGFYDLTAKIVAGKPEIYAVKGAVSNNNIIKIVDNATRTGDWSVTAATVTTLASAGDNYMFRGVAFSPVPLPLITVMPASLNSFSSFRNMPSASQSYVVSGENLLSDIVINAPTGYQISSNASSGFVNTLTLTQSDGSVANTTIFVRLTATTIGVFNGNITNLTTNGVTKNVALMGIVNEIPSITITGTPLNNFSTVDGRPSASQSYVVSGADLIADIALTAPTGFEISLSASSGFSNALNLTRTSGVVAATTIFVRLIGAGVGTPSGNLTHTSSLATTQNVALNGNVIVNNGILIIETPLQAFTTTQGTASPTSNYSVGGTNLTANIVINSPSEYEISLSASSGYGTSLTLPQNAGNVPLTPVYVRLTGANVGTPSGNIVHTSTGTSTQNVALSGTVLIRPVITVSVSSLTGFVTSEGTPSASQSFTTSGTNLISNIILNAPSDFEISTNASTGFASNLTLTQSGGAVASTIIYVRLTGGTIGSPSGNLNLNATGAVIKQVAVAGTVNPKPLITLTGSLTAFNTQEQTPSPTQTYTVNGINLVANLVLTAPTSFEISTNATTGFGSTLTLAQSGGNVANTLIYVRLASTATAGTPSGNITHTSTDAITKLITVNGTVSPYREIFLTGTPLTAFTTFVGTPSATQNFTVRGINVTDNISINAPVGFEISLAAGSGFTNTLILTQTSGSIATTPIFVRLTGASTGTPNGNIALTSTGTDPKNIAVSGTINAIPVITISGALSTFSTSLGVLASTQSYTLSAVNLLGNVSINAPAGFLISTLADGGFTSSLSLIPSNGAITSRIIYVRIIEAAIATSSGSISNSAFGATTQNIAVSGSVTGSSGATVYYVSPSGDDNNNGTSPATPFKNLSKFSFNSSPLNPGDVVYLMSGTHGPTDLAVGNTGNALVEITKSGTFANPIKFANYPGQTPLVQFNGWNGILIKASHITIDGLKVRGANSVLTLSGALNQGRSCNNPTMPFESKYNGNGINVDGRLSVSAVNPVNVTIKNCEVYECGGGGIATLEADYLTIENNITYNNAWYSVFANSGISVFHAFNSDNNTTDYKTIIRNNISYGNEQKVPWPSASCSFTDGNGIIIDDFRNTQSSSTIRGQIYLGKTLVENNVVFNNGGRGVHAYIADNCTFINNTSYNNNATATINEGEITIVNSNNARVFNNVMMARTGKKLNSYSGSVGLQEGNNLMYNGTSFGFFNNTDIMADPQFVDVNTNNFRLLPTSVGIDAGNGLQDLFGPKDILGVARPFNGRIDMGAYEFTGTVPNSSKFTEGNLVALRVGDGTTAIGTNTTNVNIIEYNTSGTASGLNIALPSTGVNSFVLGGTTTTPEGQLTLSGDGRYISAIGYNTSTGLASGINSDKIIVRIDDELNVDLSTKIPTSNALSGNFVRNAVTENGSTFFLTANTTTTSTAVAARQVVLGANTSATFAGGSGYFSMLRLGNRSYYLEFQKPGFISDAGVATILPSGAGVNTMPNFTGASEGTVFTLLDSDPAVSYNSTGFDLLYLAEKSSGIRKWYWDPASNIWVPAGIVNPTSSPAVAGGFYSVVSKMVAGKPELYAIKGSANNNTVMKIVDNAPRTGDWQTATTPTATTIVQAGNNYMFRGLTFAPVNKPENQLLAAVQGNSLLICSGSNAIFTLSGTSGATVTYNINNGTNATAVLSGGSATVTVPSATSNQTFNIVSVTNGTLTQNVAGAYLVSVTNPSVAGVVTTPQPVCAGTNSALMTLSGYSGTILGWERSLDNFATAGTYFNFLSTAYTATNLTATTSYRALIQSGACPSTVSPTSVVTVNPLPTITGTLSVNVGGTVALTGSGTAAVASPWTSATPSVATVSDAGVVTGTGVGTSLISYVNASGCTQTTTITVSASALPVTLVHFTGSLVEGKAVLKWLTSSELNVREFVVEKSSDALNFTAIGLVVPKNRLQGASYELIDAKIGEGVHSYYRLKIIDIDNTFEYSRTIALKPEFTEVDKLRISPNPVIHNAYVSYPSTSGPAVLLIVDATGKEIIRKNIVVGSIQTSLDLGLLQGGTYLVILNDQAKVLTSKLIKY